MDCLHPSAVKLLPSSSSPSSASSVMVVVSATTKDDSPPPLNPIVIDPSSSSSSSSSSTQQQEELTVLCPVEFALAVPVESPSPVHSPAAACLRLLEDLPSPLSSPGCLSLNDSGDSLTLPFPPIVTTTTTTIGTSSSSITSSTEDWSKVCHLAPKLFRAARTGDAHAVAVILALLGPNKAAALGWSDAKDPFELTPLLIAAFNGETEVVKILLDNGAPVSQCDVNMETALHKACCYGYLELVKLLLDRGAPVSAENHLHETPMDLALKKHRDNVVDVLKVPKSAP